MSALSTISNQIIGMLSTTIVSSNHNIAQATMDVNTELSDNDNLVLDMRVSYLNDDENLIVKDFFSAYNLELDTLDQSTVNIKCYQEDADKTIFTVPYTYPYFLHTTEAKHTLNLLKENLSTLMLEAVVTAESTLLPLEDMLTSAGFSKVEGAEDMWSYQLTDSLAIGLMVDEVDKTISLSTLDEKARWVGDKHTAISEAKTSLDELARNLEAIVPYQAMLVSTIPTYYQGV